MKEILLIGLTCWCFLFGSSAASVYAQASMDQGVSELSKQISNGLTENQKRTIAVVEFGDLDGHVTTLGRFLAEELITSLYQTKKFKVIERQLLNKVIAEQKLSLTGVIEQSAAQRLGKVLGVDAIASGTVTDLGNSLRVNARLIDAATGEIFAVASTEIAKDESVRKLLGPNDERQMNAGNSTDETSFQTLDDFGFTVELQPCQMGRAIVTCDLSIKNNRDDRGFTLEVDGSSLFDELGNSYAATNAQLGSLSGAGPYIDIVSGVTAKGRMSFQPLRSPATKIAMLQIHFTSFSDGRTIKFRDVPLRSEVRSTSERKVVVKDFILELESCRATAGAVVCSMTITNDAPTDRKVEFQTRSSSDSKSSRIFDEFGGEYGLANIRVGPGSTNTVVRDAVYCNSLRSQEERSRCFQENSNWLKTTLLLPKVPTRLIMTFNDVSPEAKTITNLRFTFQWIDFNHVDLNADFRGIAIRK